MILSKEEQGEGLRCSRHGLMTFGQTHNLLYNAQRNANNSSRHTRKGPFFSHMQNLIFFRFTHRDYNKLLASRVGRTKLCGYQQAVTFLQFTITNEIRARGLRSKGSILPEE